MDEQLQNSRRGASERDAVARARLLQERLRQGALDQDAVELAAYLGEPGAKDLLGEGALTPPSGLVAWVEGLAEQDRTYLDPSGYPWGQEILLRAGLACARLLEPSDRGELRLVEAFLREPRPEGRPAVWERVGQLEWAFPSDLAGGSRRPASEDELRTVVDGLLLVQCYRKPIPAIKMIRHVRGLGLVAAKRQVDALAPLSGVIAELCAEALGEDVVRAAIQASLLDWLLG